MRKLHSIIFCLAAALPLLVASCSHSDPRTQALIELRDKVEPQLSRLSPGDWIIIGPTADMESAAAYTRTKKLSVQASNITTLRQTLDLMELEGRLSPRLWVCREQEESTTNRRPGNARMRSHLNDLLTGRNHFSVDERVISMQLSIVHPEQRVLFIHTETTLPNSSIGIELDYASNPSPSHTNRQPEIKHSHGDLKS